MLMKNLNTSISLLDDLKRLADEFIGINMQKPPIFSAIKKDGKRLYAYARKNKEIEIDEREIHIIILK